MSDVAVSSARPTVAWRPASAAAAGVLAIGLVSRLDGFDLLLATGLVAALALGYANGANDVSKAIATLVGSGVADYRRAICWGSAWTTLGALAAAALATRMLGTFTTGLLASGAALTESMALATIAGALAWVQLATRLALPVSTTHAITGAVVGVGVAALGAGRVRWGSLLTNIVEPLLLSPIAALLLAVVVYAIARLVRGLPLAPIHWLSAGAASFARGLNDAPKMVALAVTFFLVRGDFDPTRQAALFAAVAIAMGLGSLLRGLRVTQTLAERVTKLDDLQSFAANLTTAGLVGLSANLGLPVSTTHVSSCAIVGIGLRGGVKAVQWKVVGDMALAWIVTLPAAALLAVAAYALLRLGHGA